VDELAAGLSVDSIRAAADWLEIESGKDSWPVEKRATHGAGMTSLHYDRAGTWTVDAATYSVRYRPAAHADPVLASWLEILSAVPQLESRPLELAMFKEMSSVTAAGMCASCHSVERGRAGGLAVNWQVFDRTSAPRMLTKFSHGPHVMLPQLADCASCHAYVEVVFFVRSPRFYERVRAGFEATLFVLSHGDVCRGKLPEVPQLSCGDCGVVAERIAQRRGGRGVSEH
jgi:hypothetical protein